MAKEEEKKDYNQLKRQTSMDEVRDNLPGFYYAALAKLLLL